MKKGGLMIEFLVTIILSILIFAMAAKFGATVFRTSTQAKTSFVDFVEDLDAFHEEGQPGDVKSIRLIMDEETVIVYYPLGSEKVKVAVDAKAPYTDFSVHFEKPVQCEEGKNCFCLFRKATNDKPVALPGYDIITVTPKRVLCAVPPADLALASCNQGEPDSVNSYQCSDGFFFERNFIKTADTWVASYYTQQRRRTLQVEHRGSELALTER